MGIRKEGLKMARLMINAVREAYGADEVRTMTVGELIEFLQDFDEDTEIILSHDNGYTYGGIRGDLMWEDEENVND